MNRYIKDANYFLKYFAANILVFAALCGLLLLREHPLQAMLPLETMLGWPLFAPLAILGGIICGLVVSTAFHNASHRNIKPVWLNTAVGEFTGAFTLEGMRNFRIGHQLHHMHADDPLLDPHPPAGQTFSHFLLTSRKRTIDCLTHLYKRHHGDGPTARRNIGLQLVAFNASLLLKLAFWFLLFGPALFFLFFAPSYAAYALGFGHLNWISHEGEAGQGKDTVKNHDGTLYYKVMNFITSGGYYHRNHHRQPWLYNPSKQTSRRAS